MEKPLFAKVALKNHFRGVYMDAVFLGDSLTFGYGVPKERSWVNLISKSVDFSYLNKGVNGDTTAGMLSRIWRDVIQISPEYCFILAGTNDFLMSRPYESIKDNICLLQKECEENNISTILMIPPYIDKEKASCCWSSTPDYDLINESLEKLKNDFIKAIDLFSLTKSSFLSGQDIYFDGIHLNEKGNSLIAAHLLNLLSEIIN